LAPWHEQLAATGAGRPWLEPWRESALCVTSEVRAGASLHSALNGRVGEALRFVPAHTLPAGTAYEQFIFETGQCPTRDNLHDFFNGLAWIGLPLTKRQLNRLQAAEIGRQGVSAERGPVRDAVTLFDESGAILQAPAAIWDALVAHDWQRLFVDLRPRWAEARLLIVGHALLEKLVRPRKDLTAHVWSRPCPVTEMAAMDRWLADEMTAERLAVKPFTPLPVLGIPGWCDENRCLSFYDDARVFRPKRVRPGRKTGAIPAAAAST
jgi:hypothetical protein